jgi:hypothetical protein
LKEVNGQLRAPTSVVEVVEGGGVWIRRYGDTHYNDIRIRLNPSLSE